MAFFRSINMYVFKFKMIMFPFKCMGVPLVSLLKSVSVKAPS